VTTKKILTLTDLASQAQTLQAQGKQIVHCHGVFDVLHLGHLRYFEAAKRHGDVLVVTITADEHVNKGPGRPVFTSDQRAEMLASLGIVDFVAVNHEKRSSEPSCFDKTCSTGGRALGVSTAHVVC
jgi:cytidyltransferase-like protein